VTDKYWNHNTYFHRVLLDAIPPGAKTALDVGCGEGVLTRQLRERVPFVTGIDLHDASLRRAQRFDDDIEYLEGDVLLYPLERNSFDVVTSVATLHHMDFELGLRRCAELLRPGGVLAVVGMARSNYTTDLLVDGWGFVRGNVERMWRKEWEHSSPVVWPLPMTRDECRRIAQRVLPGSTFTRRMWLRYTLIWTKPAT
jgi:ubiquinone/menaquinone biosynthesis C-methylase UbiE